MGELLSGKDVDGRGVDLRTFRTSWDDVDYLWYHCRIRIDANFTLVEIALERDHCDVVMLLTYEPEPDPAAAPPPLHRAISTFVAPRQGEVNLADAVRDAAFATLSVRPPSDTLAGLPQLHLTHRQTFLLAREAVELPLEGRQAVCGSITEDIYTQEGIDDAVACRGAASSPGSIPVPLVDETLAPLPVLFPPITAPADSISMERLMGSYLDLYRTTPIGPPGRTPQPITITRQRIPPPSDEVLDASPADAYYSAVWQRRVSAAAEPREPRDPERVRRAPSASHNNEAWQA
ncbi:hypothetical protein Ctob_009862 [Chrysochromulina tobinii]|uniref:Uncharacterized protein n=1 Tax=Chrysochromulina tobinii TaxID=1460289 RepID=A0A0M0JWC2_9EUKA|nr:hypothetical protein Ctob_009862 [Chrysochromulina tobinii]|eukprot:KOO30602.1 hypothetical protein Ctob_009862 [Chrysochromulina sp. CCMP291]